MKFVDEISLEIHAGKGGNGIISFRREAGVPRGGPNGGDGGHGGSVYFVGDAGNNTLLNLKNKVIINGHNGIDGSRKDMHGAKGEDIYIKIPLGTTIINQESKKIIADVIEEIPYLIAKGGIGGKGNARFKSATNSAPRICENGLRGEEFSVVLTLKILANIGFVGLPSAGKSTTLSVISNAKPKIAEYHFTTLAPQLGLVKIDGNSFVVADLPGLISGASQGKGLGFQFLKHIERCSVIAHVIDMGNEDVQPVQAYESINEELENFDSNISKKSQVIIANKSDLPHFKTNLSIFCKAYPNLNIVAISSLVDHNFDELKRLLFQTLRESNYIAPEDDETEITITLDEEIIIDNEIFGIFDISGTTIKRIYERIPLSSYDNTLRFKKALKNIGL
jgi:GTP-binding protein